MEETFPARFTSPCGRRRIFPGENEQRILRQFVPQSLTEPGVERRECLISINQDAIPRGFASECFEKIFAWFESKQLLERAHKRGRGRVEVACVEIGCCDVEFLRERAEFVQQASFANAAWTVDVENLKGKLKGCLIYAL